MVGKLHFGDVTITAVGEAGNSVTCYWVVQERKKIMDLEKILSNPKTKKLLERIMRVTVGDYFPGHKGRHTGEVGGSIPRVAGGGAINAHIEAHLGFGMSKVLKACETHKATEDETKNWTEGTIVVVKGNGKYKGNQMYVWDASTKMFVNNYDEQDKITKKEMVGRSVRTFIPTQKDGMLDYSRLMEWKQKELLRNPEWKDTSLENVTKKHMDTVLKGGDVPAVVARNRKEVVATSKKVLEGFKADKEKLKAVTHDNLQKVATLLGKEELKTGQRNVTIQQPKIVVGGKEIRLNTRNETKEQLEALSKATTENVDWAQNLKAYYDPSNLKINWEKMKRDSAKDKGMLEAIEQAEITDRFLSKCKTESDMVFRANMSPADFVAAYSMPNGLTSSMKPKDIVKMLNDKMAGAETRMMNNLSMHTKKHKPRKDESISIKYYTPKGAPIGATDISKDNFLAKMGMKARIVGAKLVKSRVEAIVQLGY